MPEIEIDDITKRFGSVPVLREVRFALEKHQRCVLFGCSGAGKSTLLRIIAGLEHAESGRILFSGQDVTRLPPSRRSVATVSQDAALYPQLNLRDNLHIAIKRLRLPRPEAHSRVETILQQLGIVDLSQRLPSQISGGEAARVAFARALVAQPKILLLDEPWSQLDGVNKQNAIQLLREITEKFRPTVLIVSHDPLDAMRVADRIVVLDQGRVIDNGPPQQVYNNPQSKRSGELLSPFGMNWLESKRLPAVFNDLPIHKRYVGFRPEQARICFADRHSETREHLNDEAADDIRLPILIHACERLGFAELAHGSIAGQAVRILTLATEQPLGQHTVVIPRRSLCQLDD
ncbi:MAG: ABC transporter ATP-binding protein [bacterium]|nr:ABC transporter ATP-binding protein [bacterium]